MDSATLESLSDTDMIDLASAFPLSMSREMSHDGELSIEPVKLMEAMGGETAEAGATYRGHTSQSRLDITL
jgi:hypothetical protein